MRRQRKRGYIMCIVCITRGSTHFAAVPLPVHLGQGRAERRQGSRVRQGREKTWNKEEERTRDRITKKRRKMNTETSARWKKHNNIGRRCKLARILFSSIRHVSCILHEGARDCSAFSILDRDEVELILCIVCIVHENHWKSLLGLPEVL